MVRMETPYTPTFLLSNLKRKSALQGSGPCGKQVCRCAGPGRPGQHGVLSTHIINISRVAGGLTTLVFFWFISMSSSVFSSLSWSSFCPGTIHQSRSQASLALCLKTTITLSSCFYAKHNNQQSVLVTDTHVALPSSCREVFVEHMNIYVYMSSFFSDRVSVIWYALGTLYANHRSNSTPAPSKKE